MMIFYHQMIQIENSIPDPSEGEKELAREDASKEVKNQQRQSLNALRNKVEGEGDRKFFRSIHEYIFSVPELKKRFLEIKKDIFNQLMDIKDQARETPAFPFLQKLLSEFETKFDDPQWSDSFIWTLRLSNFANPVESMMKMKAPAMSFRNAAKYPDVGYSSKRNEVIIASGTENMIKESEGVFYDRFEHRIFRFLMISIFEESW